MIFLKIYTIVVMSLIIIAALYDMNNKRVKTSIKTDIILIIASIPILLLAICVN